MKNIKTEFTNIDILGAEKLFNIAFEDQYGFSPNEGFFVSCETINSESDANGRPLEIEGHALSHLILLDNDFLIAVCYDSEDKEIHFEVTYNDGFREIEKND